MFTKCNITKFVICNVYNFIYTGPEKKVKPAKKGIQRIFNAFCDYFQHNTISPLFLSYPQSLCCLSDDVTKKMAKTKGKKDSKHQI